MLYRRSFMEKVQPEWLETAEGNQFMRQQNLVDAWSVFINGFGFNCGFTQTFRHPVPSAELAITKTSRLLGKSFDSIHQKLQAFIVAERHKSGDYHTHGLLIVEAQDENHMQQILTFLHDKAHAACGECKYELLRNPEGYRQYILKSLNKSSPTGLEHRFVGIKRRLAR